MGFERVLTLFLKYIVIVELIYCVKIINKIILFDSFKASTKVSTVKRVYLNGCFIDKCHCQPVDEKIKVCAFLHLLEIRSTHFSVNIQNVSILRSGVIADSFH